MSENKDNKLTLINEKTANDYLTHTREYINLKIRKAGCMIKKRIWKSYLFGFVIYMSTGNSLHPVRIVDLRERKG